MAAWLADRRPDGVLHLAGTRSEVSSTLMSELNTCFAASLMEALVLGRLDRVPILLIGSAAEYGHVSSPAPLTEQSPAHPRSHYGQTKLAQTQLGLAAAQRGQPVVAARVFNVLGRGMPSYLSLPSFAGQLRDIAAGRTEAVLRTGPLSAVRDFLPVTVVAEVLADLIRLPAAYGQLVNVCGGRPYLMRDIVNRMIGLSGIAVTLHEMEGESGADIAYGDPSRLKGLLRSAGFGPLRNADIAEVMEDSGCPVAGTDGNRTLLPTWKPQAPRHRACRTADIPAAGSPVHAHTVSPPAEN